MTTRFPHLFSPLKIGAITVANRIFQPAHAKGFDEHVDNYVITSEREAYYHAERAKGGAGLLIMGEQNVHYTAGDHGGQLEPHAYRKEIVPRYRVIADMVHQYGTKIFSQIAHTGIMSFGYYQDDLAEVWGPSALAGLGYGATKEMEVEDIQEVIEGYAQVAKNTKDGGLDGIEIHAAHAYLPHQFLSPISNKRTDKYGGDLDGRMRFLLEAIEAVRAAVGREFPVGVRISADEFSPGGLTLDDMKQVAKVLEGTGKIDYINVSAGANWTDTTAAPMIPLYNAPPGLLVPLAAAIKQVVKSIPIFTVGKINGPELAERILAEGQADMVGMARALICDPELPIKAREGRVGDIRACIYCLQGCLLRGAQGLAIGCVQNPAVGREKRFGSGTLKPAVKRKRVMVIGGGPAGLKAAEIAARRGHEVVLYEKESELGGQVRLAARTPLRQEYGEVTRYLANQVMKLGVKINLGQEVSSDLVFADNPDAVVVATGCKPIKTIFLRDRLAEETIPGVEQDNVISIWDVLMGSVKIGQRILIVDADRHQRNLVTAHFLASQGRKVEMVTNSGSIMPTRIHPREAVLLGKVTREKGIVVHVSSFVKAITGDRVILLDRAANKEEALDGVDTIVWATGARAYDELYFALKGRVKELHRIGDCVAPRYVDFAIWEGEKVGREL